MNKYLMPAILAATVLVAGVFAMMPVQKASTIHTALTGIVGATGDFDGDGVANGVDNCPAVDNPGPGQADVDADGVGTACDTAVGVGIAGT